jgi:hypothetical protein
MLKKLLAVVAVTTMALVASVGVSSAQGPPPGGPPYPPPRNIIIAPGNPDLVFNPGGPATFQAECFLPGSTVTFALDGVVLGTAIANADGVATITTTIPADTPLGPATVTATGTGCDGEALSLALGVTISAAQAPTEPLPRTGSDTTLPLAQIAVATIVAGGFLLIMANKRRAAVVPATTHKRSPEA